ncbi:heavy metal sensor histidine kinase [Variovorax robiniae]|uniref:Sensor protein n=1 Tax=Variovorax robiniae TaxID=1836199 RepID=A0ABU8XB56_9BURK
MNSRSIQASLSRWFALQTFVGLSLVCGAIYALTMWSFQLKQASEFDRHVEFVTHLLSEPANIANRSELKHKLDDFFLSHDDIGIVLMEDSRLLYASTPKRKAAEWVWTPVDLANVSAGTLNTQLRLGIDVQEDARLLRRLAWTLVGAVFLGSLLVSLTGVLLVRRGLKPLQKLAAQTAETGPEHPGRRVDAGPYASELLPWISQFNAVLERAEQAYQQLESFNADVAHELRTPLTNMIAEVEIELARPRTPDALRDGLASNLEEARRLSAIVSDMLFLSKSDRGALARRSDPVSLAEQVQAVAEFHEAALEQANLRVQVSGDARMSVDVALVRRAISNLVGNAIRYALPATIIAVVVERAGEAVWLKVANRGETIAPEALPHLFKRFFRADRSRAGSAEHHGLGLAIVSAIARMHGGETRVRSIAGFTEICFSLMPPAADGRPRITQS